MTEATPAKKKAPAKKAAAKKVATKKAPTAKKDDKPVVHKGIDAVVFDQFKVRAGSLKEKLIRHFVANKGKWIESSQLQTLLYAKPSEAAAGALTMVMKGVKVAIEKEKLAYAVEHQRDEGVTSFRLVATK